jgi:ABC-type sugar transport system ATPase subunit
MKIRGELVTLRNLGKAINHGIGYLTEDRKNASLMLRLDLEKNINMASIQNISHDFILRR